MTSAKLNRSKLGLHLANLVSLISVMIRITGCASVDRCILVVTVDAITDVEVRHLVL